MKNDKEKKCTSSDLFKDIRQTKKLTIPTVKAPGRHLLYSTFWGCFVTSGAGSLEVSAKYLLTMSTKSYKKWATHQPLDLELSSLLTLGDYINFIAVYLFSTNWQQKWSQATIQCDVTVYKDTTTWIQNIKQVSAVLNNLKTIMFSLLSVCWKMNRLTLCSLFQHPGFAVRRAMQDFIWETSKERCKSQEIWHFALICLALLCNALLTWYSPN